MSRRKKRYTPKTFESDGRTNDTSANIYESMLESKAFKDLTKNQRLLYVYMKAQHYGKRKPGKDFPDREDLQEESVFYFNMAVAEKYVLYSRNNHTSFYNDIKALVNHGFIRVVSTGKTVMKKSIYDFCGDWKNWDDTI